MPGTDSTTRVRYESVQDLANRIRLVSRNIIKDLQEMDSALKVVTDTWEGEAHIEYVTLQTKYRAKAEHMKDRLEQVSRLIEQGRDGYRSTDMKAASLFTGGR